MNGNHRSGDALEGNLELPQADGQELQIRSQSFEELQREFSWGTSPELFDMEMSGEPVSSISPIACNLQQGGARSVTKTRLRSECCVQNHILSAYERREASSADFMQRGVSPSNLMK